MDKLWSIQTLEYYSASQRNELSNPAKTQRKLKCLWLSVKSQPEKAAYSKIPTVWQHSGKGKTKEIIKRSVVGGEGRMRISRMAKLLCMELQWCIHVTVPLSTPRCQQWTLMSTKDWVITCNTGSQTVTMAHTLDWDIDKGKGYVMCGGKGYMGTLCTFHFLLLWT